MSPMLDTYGFVTSDTALRTRVAGYPATAWASR